MPSALRACRSPAACWTSASITLYVFHPRLPPVAAARRPHCSPRGGAGQIEHCRGCQSAASSRRSLRLPSRRKHCQQPPPRCLLHPASLPQHTPGLHALSVSCVTCAPQPLRAWMATATGPASCASRGPLQEEWPSLAAVTSSQQQQQSSPVGSSLDREAAGAVTGSAAAGRAGPKAARRGRGSSARGAAAPQGGGSGAATKPAAGE